MARKSRTVPQSVQTASDKEYNTAIYARLSVEDRYGMKNDSIDNQICLIKQYVVERPCLKLRAEFSDNGETGTNFRRAGFNAMMEEIKAGRINCVVVKDLSRFGRNYIETGEYLEKIFPFMGVRFISVNDGLDSEISNYSTDALIVNLKNLINDIYAKDISHKTISSVRMMQKNGEHLGMAPYGYLKSSEDKHKLVVDETTAPVVRDIFRWKAEGLGDRLIARRLNDMRIPTPTKVKLESGIQKDAGRCKHFIWCVRTIYRITTNPMYLGHMTQGRTRQALCDNMPVKSQSRSEWIIVENTHEPIVDKATFDKAQEARERNKHERIHDGSVYKAFSGGR